MGCPHSSNRKDFSRYFRRDVVKTALAAGGVSGLAACLDEAGVPDVPQGYDDISDVPERQFAWNDYMALDRHQNTVFPVHQLILLFDYVGTIPPTAEERKAIRDIFSTLDQAYQRGNGDINPYGPGGENMPGLLYMMGYSKEFFNRFGHDLPDTLGFYSAGELVENIDNETEVDKADAALVLASDHVQVLLSVELALQKDVATLNGIDVKGGIEGIFEVVDRRTGFVGPTVPRRKLDRDEIPKRSPLSMGFQSGFRDNQASEDRVAIQNGPFKEGTTLQLSRLKIDLDAWYEHEEETQISLMFSPDHEEDDIGQAGELLAGKSGLIEEMEESMEKNADEDGVIGHTQKLAAARDDNFEPTILRRSEAVSVDEPSPGMNFTSVQRHLDDFVEVRQAMDKPDVNTEVDEEFNGILDYHTVEKRGTYLVPPRDKIALPAPQPDR